MSRKAGIIAPSPPPPCTFFELVRMVRNMATKKNDIALSFDKAEYYTLQEASEYLNRKQGIDNITPKKLLKQISFRGINTYIHFRIQANDIFYFDFDNYDSNIFFNDEIRDKKNFINDDEYYKYLLQVSEQIRKQVSNRIIDDLYMGFILFKVHNQALHNLALSFEPLIPTHYLLFDGLLEINDLNRNPSTPKILEESTYTDEDVEFKFYDISNISFKVNSIDDNELQKIASYLPYKISFDKRDNFSFIEPHIDINDLLIIHADLEKLESQIVENKPIESNFLKKQGVSPKTLLMQHLAKDIAETEWKNDKDKSIKITAMCEIVRERFIEFGYGHRLPKNNENLKTWIRNIAPSYASESGRPTEK